MLKQWAGCRAEPLISVPVSLLLHAEVGLSDPMYGEALRALRAEAGTELDNRVMLVLTFLVERLKGRQSRWATYINNLPEKYGATSDAPPSVTIERAACQPPAQLHAHLCVGRRCACAAVSSSSHRGLCCAQMTRHGGMSTMRSC